MIKDKLQNIYQLNSNTPVHINEYIYVHMYELITTLNFI